MHSLIIYLRHNNDYSVAIPSSIHNSVTTHLLREDGQEDLCFALWHPSNGYQRMTALIYKIILPEPGERRVHGNVGFMPQYFERVLHLALEENAGIALMHSHPSPGWQNMSLDDVNAERSYAGAVKSATGLPFVGLTIGTDTSWSARFWIKSAPKIYERHWCHSVRVVGEGLNFTLHPETSTRALHSTALERTVSAWGDEVQTILANIRVGL